MKYKKRIILLIFVFLLLTFSYHFDLRNINSYTSFLYNKTKYDSSCTTGEGTVMYVTEDNVQVKDNPSISANKLTTLNKCSEVKVYCNQNNYARVSKEPGKWVSTNYLSDTLPSECSTSQTTTTDSIKFSFDSLEASYGDYDQFYRDRGAILTAKLSNITNLASDDTELIDVRISLNAINKTDQFEITRHELNNGYMDIDISSKSTQIYDVGTYKVTITAGNVTYYKTFDIVDYYYNFEGKLENVTNYVGNPIDEENIWKINLIKDGITNNSGFSIKITKNNRDYTNKFNYTLDDDGYTLSNKYNSILTRPSSGDYKIIVSYYLESYSTSRGTITVEFDITLSKRTIKFEQVSYESHRYDRVRQEQPYNILITKYKDDYVSYYEDDMLHEKSKEEFKGIYADFDFEKIYFNETNGLVNYRYNETCTVTNYTTTNVTYIDENNISHTVTEEEFMTLFNEAYTNINDGTYQFASDGTLYYKVSGVKLADKKTLRPENKNIYANQGGVFNLVYRYDTKKLNQEDFDDADIKIVRKDNTEVGIRENFYNELTIEDDLVYIEIIYDDILESNVGDYNLVLSFPDASPVSIPFTLYDGDVDYYIQAQVDDHLTSDKPMPTTPYPPANQKYEYYIGFYLVKGGAVQTTKNTDSINVSIYDHRADLDSDGNLYCYDQVEYTFKIINYLNNNVKYEVSLDGSEFTTHTDTLDNLKTSNYKDVASLIEKYNYDASGNIVSDNFPLHINRVYQDENNIRYVTYNNNETTITELLDDFQISNAEMNEYIINRFVFDDDPSSGLIELGALRGNYRVNSSTCNNVTDQFDIEIIDDDTELIRAIKVLPKTEVEMHTYYAYVSYGILPGVGYVNNKEDAVITREAFPENWNQNIHMVPLSYDKEIYDLEFGESKLSNTGNKKSRMYQNISSNITIPINYEFIYDFSKFETQILYKIDDDTWEDRTSDFNIINTLDNSKETFNLDNSSLSITNKEGITSSGVYKVLLSYQNKSSDKTTISREFEINEKYYNIVRTDDEDISFIHNYEKTYEFNYQTSFISLANLDNIVPNISRNIDGGSEILTLDKTNKTFTNTNNDIVFNYTYQYEKIDDNTYNYKILLTNVRDVTDVGLYTLELTYQEEGLELISNNNDFKVIDDEYIFTLSEPIFKSDSSGKTISFDIDTEYIYKTELKNFVFKVMHYESGVGDVDVLSDNSMFTHTITFEDTDDSTKYHGRLVLTVKDDAILEDFYYLQVVFKTTIDEASIGILKDDFTWSIESLTTTGSYHDDVTNKDITLNKFYKNIKNTQINVMISGVHEDNIKYNINKECLKESTCIPDYTETSFNNRFIENNTTGENGLLTLTLKDNETIESGEYALVLYYGKNDYVVRTLRIYDDYASIELEDPIIYSKINESLYKDELYCNKDGYIYSPIKVYGVGYDEVSVKVVDKYNKTAPFTYDKLELINNHKLVVNYLGNNNITPGTYTIIVSYDSTNTTYESSLNIVVNGDYFDFTLSEETLTPNPLYPNSSDGGTITYKVDTTDIKNLILGSDGKDTSANKHVFARNTVILNGAGENVTDDFSISTKDIEGSGSSFYLVIHYNKNAILPGTYEIKVSYNVNTSSKTVSKTVIVEDYLKTLEIDDVIIDTSASDQKMHRNIQGTYKLQYTSDYTLITSNIKASIYKDDTLIDDGNFTVTVDKNYINIRYNALLNLTSGTYKAHITYQEEGNNEFSLDVNLKMYGTYNEITLDNLEKSNDIMYADKDGYYKFRVNKEAFMSQINDLKVRIFDSNKNIVYSSFENEGINYFNVINDLNNTSNFIINIMPFKADIDSYSIMLYLSDEDGYYYNSNALDFTIDDYYYKVNIIESSVKQVLTYNNDLSSIYDVDGAKVTFKFTSDYKYPDKYKLLLKKNNTLVATYENITTLNDNYIFDFNTNKIASGNYTLSLVNDNLVYKTISFVVKQYIPVTSINININNKTVSSFSMNYDDRATISYTYSPSNATNPVFTKKSSDTSKLVIGSTLMVAKNSGTVTLSVSCKDLTKSIVVTISNRVTSSKYKVSYGSKNTIYVNSMTSSTMSKKTLVNNLVGLNSSYKIYDKNNKDVTSTTSYIGTGYRIVSNNQTYYIAIIGDLNGDGKITTSDVAYLYQYIRGKTKLKDDYVKMSADIRKKNSISLGDVAKLYQFVRGKINSL